MFWFDLCIFDFGYSEEVIVVMVEFFRIYFDENVLEVKDDVINCIISFLERLNVLIMDFLFIFLLVAVLEGEFIY